MIEKYDVYHLHVKHGSYYSKNNYLEKVKESWTKYLDENHYKEVTLENIAMQQNYILEGDNGAIE